MNDQLANLQQLISVSSETLSNIMSETRTAESLIDNMTAEQYSNLRSELRRQEQVFALVVEKAVMKFNTFSE